MKNKQKGSTALVVLIIVIIVLAVFSYSYFNRTASRSQPTPTNNKSFDITDLGVRFTLPDELSDLTYTVVHLSGDQAVNSVGFSDKRLEAAGCSAAMAPLGYLTYDSYKGGVVVGHARGSQLSYLKPDKKCSADISLQNLGVLENALHSIESDYTPVEV